MLQSGNGYKNTNQKRCLRKEQIQEYVIDETIIKVGSEYIWLWVAIESETKGYSLNKHIQGKKYVCCRAFFIERLYMNMENILFQLMVVLGLHKLAGF